MATILTSTPRLAEFVLSEARGQRSRENIVVTQTGAAVKSGTLLTQSGDAGAGAFAMQAGATGNPTSGSVTIGAAAKAGVYRGRFTAATKFTVEDPDGVTIGNGTLGTAFNKSGMGFTLSAGGTAAVDGDEFQIGVAVGTLKYTPYVAAGASGPAAAVLYSYLPAATGDSRAVGFVRDCEVNRAALTGLDTPAVAQLRGNGVIVRGVYAPD